MICFGVGTSGQILVLADGVLEHFDCHKQVTNQHLEAGGQLFARFDGNVVRIDQATGPRATDRRSIKSFIPNRLMERCEIRRLFKIGLHYVGDWHTHPEQQPTPSGTDVGSFRDMFLKSKHRLASFVMIIVGTAPLPSGLFVALCTGNRLHKLTVSDHR